VSAERIGQLVVGLTGARLARAAFLGSIGAQEVGAALDGDVVLFR